MNNNIEPHYVTFEQAKWLKEIGFDVPCERFYVKPNSKIFGIDEHGKYYPIKNIPKKAYKAGNVAALNISNVVYAPEHWQVVEFLRINHGIWILVLPQDKSAIDYRIGKNKYPNHALFFSIIKYEEDCSCKECINTSDDKGELFLHFDSPQESYSAAFDYIKNNNLI
jgi:hypothetical protein